MPKNKKNIEGITVSKDENFSEWYIQVINKAELLQYTDISGCYVFRPWCYAVWEGIQGFFDGKIKRSGVKNCYFPCFVSEEQLNAEADFIEDFNPEVAWVTRAGSSELKQPIALRPTSETIMYPLFQKWVQSHRDLPLRINQWCNVVRWEFKHPVPFIRGREFLWQEGHSAFATKDEAEAEVLEILDYYAKVYTDLLAVPVYKGKKTDMEKFPGGDYTTTVEIFVPGNGRSIQAATSHHLGQNFAKAFGIEFEVSPGEKDFAYQNSWGLSTRSIGAMVMVHGDDKGLVLPPRVAPIQVMVVPITRKNNEEEVMAAAKALVEELLDAGIRCEGDYRTYIRPGRKYGMYELKGIPLRLEIGGRDIENNCVMMKRRDADNKEKISRDDLIETIKTTMDEMHDNLYNKALENRDAHMRTANSLEELVENLNGNFVLAPFCGKPDCEENIKQYTEEKSAANEGEETFGLTGKAKSLCFPFSEQDMEEGTTCFACGEPAVGKCLFGRSY